MVILDTNIVIDHIRQPHKKDSYYTSLVENRLNEVFALSIVSIQELYVGKSIADKEIERYVLSTISSLELLAYTYEVSQFAGELMRESQRTIGFADAAIAATAIMNGASLYTLNRKDFEGIKRLELFTL